jgi:hypothetical protein
MENSEITKVISSNTVINLMNRKYQTRAKTKTQTIEITVYYFFLLKYSIVKYWEAA